MSVIKIDPNNAMSYSAFGAKDDFGGVPAISILGGDRFEDLQRKQAYYECTQHDAKRWDFDGRPISPRSTQPLLGAERSWWVPLKMRRPSMTYRLGKIIVDSFTNLLFGENRFPTIRCEGDHKTEDFLQTIARVGRLPLKMIRARNLGGACGTVGVSWCFRHGKPRFEVHEAKNLFVHTWDDRLELIPSHVTEVYLFSKTKWDGKAFTKQWYWFRRDWTQEADIVFEDEPVPQDPNKQIEWKVDMSRSNFHGDGVCHLEWIQNLPSDEIDGVPDYEGLYEDFDVIDTLTSVVSKGAISNLDPTLKVKMDRMEMDFHGIRKGSENAVVVGKDGDADYLELSGSSIDAGIKLIEALRRTTLETAQCVVPDPHEVAAQGTSSVAMKMMYAPMTSKADVLREQYGMAIERMLSNIARVCREKLAADVTVIEEVEEEDGKKKTTETAARFFIALPPKIEKEKLVDPLTNEETDEEIERKIEREPGDGEEVSLQWPPYFAPTPQDQGQVATFLQTATGGQPFLSQQTAVEQAAHATGTDPAEEWKRVRDQGKKQAEQEQGMLAGDPGGGVQAPNQLPPGAEEKEEPPPGEAPPADDEDPDAHIPVDVDLTGQ